jgi:hypothetical protein
MSSDDDYHGDPSSGMQRMVLFRAGDTNRAIALGRGLNIAEYTDSQTNRPYLSVSVGTFGKYSSDFNVQADPAQMEPKNTDMGLFDKVMLRFRAAAKNNTDVDLRFCTGNEATRNPAQDNLRPGYGDWKIG